MFLAITVQLPLEFLVDPMRHRDHAIIVPENASIYKLKLAECLPTQRADLTQSREAAEV